MSAIAKLKEVALVNRIMNEVEKSCGIKEKVLAEFIVSEGGKWCDS